MKSNAQGLQKQVSLYFPLETWKLLRDSAIKNNTTMSAMIRSWAEPHIQKLEKQNDPSK